VRLLLVTPAPRRSRKGNRVTALRWAAHLRALGHGVRVRETWQDEPCDVLVALHAVKSADSVARFRAAHPAGHVVVAVTGTDLEDGGIGEVARRTLDAATRIVVLQPNAAAALPPDLRRKTRTILQSARVDEPPARPATDAFEVCVVGHLREVKDPFRAAEAARRLPPSSRVRVVHVGAALSEPMAVRARAEETANRRYRWLGERTHRETMRVLARSRLLVLTSLSEGGANVVSEALAARVPVVASRIPGTTGLLGDDYPGLFDAGDTEALAALLVRAESDAKFMNGLRSACERLRTLVVPARERRAWAGLLAELRLESEFGASVQAGLTASPKRLPCRWFYDEEGSALFEEICSVPEYYIPAAERELLTAHAGDLAASVPRGATVVELGSGSAQKTRLVLDALLRRNPRLRYVPVDISAAALDESERALRAAYPALDVQPVLGEYEDGVALLRETAGPKLVLWLGSNIGNLARDEAAAFLGRLAATLGPADRLLVGIDLRKDAAVIERAYDDAAGVTARFNLNLLARVNRQLGGAFELPRFRHRAVWREEEGRVEMHLVARDAMTVPVRALGIEVHLDRDESIHTEDSYKYSDEEIDALSREAGLRVVHHWVDSRELFADVVFARDA
jgi:dimethylhistidine N-methyltransferase